MKKAVKKGKIFGLSTIGILSFFSSLIVCSVLSYVIIINGVKLERLQAEQIILEKAYRINVVISKLLYKTNSLAAMVMQGNGVVEDFDKISNLIINEPAILNVILAPDGIATNVYPKTDGNSAVLGWDFFSDSAVGNKEAVMARDTGALVLAGPFRLAQGREVITGRLPVYLDTPQEENKFWGLVSVTLKFPQALDEVDMEVLIPENSANLEIGRFYEVEVFDAGEYDLYGKNRSVSRLVP